MGSKSEVFNLENIQLGNCTCRSQILLMHAFPLRQNKDLSYMLSLLNVFDHIPEERKDSAHMF